MDPLPVADKTLNLPNSFTLQDHIEASWRRLKENLLKVFILHIISFIGIIILLIATGAIGFGLTVSNQQVVKILSSWSPNSFPGLKDIPNSYYFSMGGLLLAYIICAAIIGSVSSIGTLLSLHTSNKSSSLMNIIKQSIRLIPLAILFGIVSFILVFGGLGLFIIAGIAIQIFISFGFYVTVFEKKKPFAAIHRSVQFVSSEFGLVLGRVILIFLASIVVTLIFQTFNRGDIKPYIGLLTGIFNIFMGWFSVAYFIELYEHLNAKIPEEKPTSTIWIYILSLLGWVLILLVIYLGVSFVWPKISAAIKSDMNKETQTSSAIISNYVPSNCGLSVPLPGTADKGTGRYWIYEERPLEQDSFRDLAPASVTKSGVLGAIVSFKTNDQRFKDGDKTFKINYPGINIICVGNTAKYTLDDFVAQAQKSTKYKVTLDQKDMFGKVTIQSIWVEGVDAQGDYFKEPLHLGVSEDGNRLFYIKIWANPSTTQTIDKQISSDIDAILDNLSYREVSASIKTSTTAPTSNTTKSSNCTQYKIYEGEFASDKCYSSQDYKDLQYYLSAYNSAVFSYNGAISSMRITCSGSDFFKDSCDRDKSQKDEAEKKINEYKSTIQGIIARGK
jgi:hypothetical protein